MPWSVARNRENEVVELRVRYRFWLPAKIEREDLDFLAMEAVESANKKTILDFAKRRIKASHIVRTDGLPANNDLHLHVTHISKVTPPEMSNTWLPWVHIAIANLKRFLLGTFHGTSKRCLQDYLNEFCYRFNRRYWETEIPNRLLRLCVEHRPII